MLYKAKLMACLLCCFQWILSRGFYPKQNTKPFFFSLFRPLKLLRNDILEYTLEVKGSKTTGIYKRILSVKGTLDFSFRENRENLWAGGGGDRKTGLFWCKKKVEIHTSIHRSFSCSVEFLKTPCMTLCAFSPCLLTGLW